MGQRDTLRSLDAAVHAAMASGGFAESGTYTPPSGSPVTCRVYRDDVAIDEFGDVRSAVNLRTEIGLLRADVDIPKKGGTLLLDGITYTLEAKVSEDQSVSRWVVRA